MCDFSISCEYLENIRSIVKEFPEYRDKICTIIVNETFKIELPLIVAAAFSSSITKTIKNDPTANEFSFTLERYSIESLNKIKSVLCEHSKVWLNEENDIYTFAEFGLAIGNKDFINPLNTRLAKDVSGMNENNVVQILSSKKAFHIEDTKQEISFIAEHFETISKREDFIRFSLEAPNTKIIDEIISSDKLYMNNEDTLLSFLLAINKSKTIDNISAELFNHLFIEYCSPDKCEEFINFVCGIAQQQGIKPLLSCIKRRFIQPNIPVKQKYIRRRHVGHEKIIGSEDPLSGILHREHEKKNVLLDAPHLGVSNKDGIYNLVKASDDSYFHTKSYITASLKNCKTFIVKSYMIRGSRYEDIDCQIKSWKFEGQKASNGEWIVLDSHDNDPTKKLQIRTFGVSCDEELRSIRLTQTGTNTLNTDLLCINAFDIFGILYVE